MSEKKSWRDIDRKRDQSSHRREGGGGRQPRVESATAEYKRSLDAFFYRGVVPEHLKDKLPPGTSEGPSERQLLIRAIKDAKTKRALEKSFDQLITDFGFPDDPELWLLALGHSQDATILQALTKIEEYLETGQVLPRKVRFIQPLKGLEFSSFDPRVQAKAVRLADQLR